MLPVRAALAGQGWRPDAPTTVIGDAEAALPELARRAAGSDVAHILGWWRTRMRVRHAERALQGVHALEPVHDAGLDVARRRLSRVRHPLWNGCRDKARRELFGLRRLAGEAVRLNKGRLRAPVARFLSRCDALHGHLADNEAASIDYGSRHRAGLPVPTSRAEGCADEIANKDGGTAPDALVAAWRPPRRRRARRRARRSAHARTQTLPKAA